MAFKDVLSLCGRIGLIMAAFAFVAGIVAGPLLGRIWSPGLIVTGQGSEAVPLPPKSPAETQGGKQS